MESNRPITKKLISVRQDIVRGDSILTLLIFVVVGVFLINLIASLWHNIRFQRDVTAEASVQNTKSISSLLAKTAGVLLTTNELSMLRRTVAEAGLEYQFESCRVALPDGGVIADSDPGKISVLDLPDSWVGSVGAYSETRSAERVTFKFPLEVRGRGIASMEVIANLGNTRVAQLEPQAPQLALSCLALATILLIHRHARFRMKAIGAIHEALSMVTEGTNDVSALELDPQLGTEAVAWNRLLQAKQGQQVREEIEHIKMSLHEAKKARTEFSQICDMLPQGLVLVSNDARIEYANGAAAILLQTDRSQLTHSEISRSIDNQQVVQAIRDALVNRATRTTGLESVSDSSATSTVLRFTICPLCGEDLRSVMVLIDDITQQRIAQASRDTFLAKAAHELRTPLTNIRLQVEHAVDCSEGDPTAVTDCLNVINEESRRLERTVSEVLSVAEIEAGSFSLHRDDVHLDDLLTQLRNDYEPSAQEKNISLRFDLPPKLPIISADRSKISLVMHNLLGNAIKYTPENGHVTVSATIENGQLTFDVSDTGIGISQDELPRVFEKFYRSTDKRVTHITGSGLGLAIAREIVSLHGGMISAESELNKGSTFTLALPIADTEVLDEDANTAARRGSCDQAQRTHSSRGNG